MKRGKELSTVNGQLSTDVRGEMTTQQIVTLIILITSFAVILFFLGRLALGEEADKELCRNSVLTRAASIIPTDSIPLDCKRSYVCITKDGSCEKMHKPILKEVSDNHDVYQILAEELADCWWMFGEGKIDYIGDEMLPGLNCALCSQIAFDNSVKDIFKDGSFSKEDFYDYMNRENISEGRSYLDYLDLGYIFDAEYSDFGRVKLDDQYYALTGMVPELSKWKWAAALAVGGIVVVPVVLGVSTIAVISGGAVGGAGGYMLLAPALKSSGLFEGKTFYPPALVSTGSEEFRSLDCKEITTSS